MSIPTVTNFDVTRIPYEGSPTFRADASYVWGRNPVVIDSINSAIVEMNNTSVELNAIEDRVQNQAVDGGYSRAYLDENMVTKPATIMAIGNINNPLLDLPLNNSLDMKQGVGSVAFTRGTTATYIDRYGVLKTAAIDEPRFEKDGLLIEGSSTNLLTYSNDGATTMVTKTLNSVTGPDGISNSAGTYVGNGVEGHHYVEKVVSVPDDDSSYTVSVFVKKGTADKITYTCYLISGTSAGAYCSFTFSTETAINCKYEKLADGWYRLSTTVQNNTSGSTILYNRVYVDDDALGASSTSTDTLYIYGFQSEKLQFASSYIPTTASAVTRGGDIAEYAAVNNLSNSKFTTIVDINSKTKRPNQNSSAIIWSSATDSYGYRLMFWNGNDNNILNYYNGVQHVFQTSSQKYRLAVVYDGVNLISYINGIEVRRTQRTEYNFDLNTFVLHAPYMSINFRNIRTYDMALTAEEVRLA